jgi:hypothetical protein
MMTFIHKDAITNIDVKRDDKHVVNIDTEFGFMKNRIPIGTQTYIFKTKKLDKDWKLDRANFKAKELQKNKTDHISYDPPQSNKPDQMEFDMQTTKPRYTKNFQS